MGTDDRTSLSIDVGTTTTAAAVTLDGEPRVLELGGRARMPSTVLLREDGTLMVGEAADAQAALDPARVERTPKRRLGDGVLLLGGEPVDPVDAVAAILGHVGAAATTFLGGAPDELVLTHPAAWGRSRTGLLVEAAGRAALPAPVLVPEPIAAAVHVAHDVAQPGDVLAVYDLGGGTFDAAVVRRIEHRFEVAGPPGGDATLGGEVLDELLGAQVLVAIDDRLVDLLMADDSRAGAQARFRFRADVRSAKEALSTDDEFRWYAGPPLDLELALTAGELERTIEDAVARTVRSLAETVRRAGLAPGDLAGVVMVGGGARAPIVERVLTRAFGRAPLTWGDPKAAVSLGAARLAAARPPDRPAPPPAPVERVPSTEAPPPSLPDARVGGVAVADLLPPPADELEVPHEPPAPVRGWTAEQVGVFLAVLLVVLGVGSALIAILVL